MALIKLNNRETGAIVAAGDIVDSGLLSSILGVIIYSPTHRQAYAENLIAVEEGLEKIALCAVNRFGNPLNLDAYLAGLSFDTDMEEDLARSIAEERSVAREALLRHSFDPARIRIRWGPQDSYMYILFDPEKGIAMLRVSDYLGRTIYSGRFEDAPLFIN